MSCKVLIHNDDYSRLALDWQNEDHHSDKYSAQCKKFISMWAEFQLTRNGHIRSLSVSSLRIKLVNVKTQSIHLASYRDGPKIRAFEKTWIENMMSRKVVKPTQTRWAVPIISVQVKNGTLRFCIEYLKFKPVAKQDPHPILRMNECIESFGETKIFFNWDANSRYCQVEIDKVDKDKTPFTFHHELYQLIRTPFGLREAPSTIHRITSFILSTPRFHFILVFLDDIVIFSVSLWEHIGHVRTVLIIFHNLSVPLRFEKWQSFADRIN